MQMKDLPPGGTQQDKIDVAPDFFRNVVHKDTGDHVTVTATIEPFGKLQILVVETAK